MADNLSPGARFRQAVREEQPLQVVGTINAYHARLAEASGFKALYISGGGVAAGSCGIPDLGITSLEDVLTDLRRITDVTSLPVLVDIDTGWGGAFNIARAWASRTRADGSLETTNGGIVGFFSLEMSSEQLATRIIAEQSGVPSWKIRRGDITEMEFHRISEAAREMQSIPFYIDQTGGISIAQLMARARRLKRQRGLDLLVIDYLQLLSGSKSRGDNRVQELTEITTSLKALAKELKVPVLALSQLSRQVEARDDKRPQLSDLRESGSIEQDADVVLFVYREEYYLKNREPKPGTEEHVTWMTNMEAAHGKAEVIIGKQRHGPTDTVRLQFDAEVTRFSDLVEDDRLPARL
jgi:replicative DNA helicase